MAESYEPIELLGSGAFAQTWRVRILDAHMKKEWGTDEAAMKCPVSHEKARALKKEVELNASLFLDTASMKSPNIVKYYGFDVYQGQIVLFTEYIKGGDLRKEIGEIGSWRKISENRALAIVSGILQGLKVIHEKNIIHRDIKPENILLDNGVPKLADFGVGRFMGSREFATSSTGTLFYMAPEILLSTYDHKATYNSDIWSVGVMFHEMLFGKFPFGIDYHMPIGNIVQAVQEACPDSIADEDGSVSKGIKEIIARSLVHDPQTRYQSAKQMLNDLEPYVKEREKAPPKEYSPEDEIRAILNYADGAQDAVEIQNKLKEIGGKYSRNVRVYRVLGEFFNCRSDSDAAIRFFLKGIACCKDDPLSYWGLAMSYMKKGETDKAIQHLKSAIKFGLEPGREKYAKLLITKLKKQAIEE